MKRFLTVCLMALLNLPVPAILPVAALGLAGVTVLSAPAVVYADTEVLADDAAVLDNEVLDDVVVVDGEHHDGDHADEAKSPLLSFDFGSAFWNLVIFVCVLAILSIFVWPSVLGGLQSRENKIREDLESAERANAQAQAILAGYQSKLDEAAVQAQAVLAQARQDAEINGQKIIDDAKAAAASQRERAVAEIETAKKVAMAEIASHTSEMAMQVARGVVGRELSATDHADLIQQAMGRLPSQN